MNPRLFLNLDPRQLRLPPNRSDGADPMKLHRQIAKFGHSISSMPPILVYRGIDGGLLITDGVTRATRAAKLCPGDLVPIEVMSDLPRRFLPLPSIEEKLP